MVHREEPHQVELIENREIRGLSYKTGLTVLISTITIVVSLVTIYFLLKAEIGNIRLEKAKDDKYNDMRMNIIETNMKVLDQKIDNLTNQINFNQQKK